MKEDDPYQKTLGNMIFSVYMPRRQGFGIAPLAKIRKMPRKNTSQGVIFDITEKYDIYP